MAVKRESASAKAARRRDEFACECRNILRRASRRTPDKAPDTHAAELRGQLQAALAAHTGEPLTMRAWHAVELLNRVDRYEQSIAE